MQASNVTHQEIFFEPIKVKLPVETSDKINKIYSVANRSYAIYQKFVLNWGNKVYTKNQDKIQQFEVIPIEVTSLALGTNHTFAYTTKHQESLNQKRKVFCWGSNKNYQLGLQQERNYGLSQLGIFDQAFEEGFKLIQISCGEAHTLALLSDQQTGQSKLFGWGQSKSYQLALDTTSIVPYPVDIEYEFTPSIKKIYSRSDYNIALTKQGDLYSWGSNLFNRLGVNLSKNLRNSPTQKKISEKDFQKDQFKKQQEKNTVRRSSFVQTSANTILKVKIPRKINLNDTKIKEVALGAFHVITLTVEGLCITWGNGIYGQLGNNKFGQSFPQFISIDRLNKNIKFVSCTTGEQHSCLLDQQGNVYTCGSNAYGALGHQKHENQTKKKRCKLFEKIQYFSQNNIQIIQIVSGDRHCLALSKDRQLYGWGSNKFQQIVSQFEDQQRLNFQDSNFQLTLQKNTYSKSQHEKNKEQFLKILRKQPDQNEIKNNLLIKRQNKQFQVWKDEEIQVNNKISVQKIKQWKVKYQQFLTKKRKQQDQLLQQLDKLLISNNQLQ